MAKRLTVLVLLVFVLPATAYAATVKVRVEGKTKTLFAPTEITVTASNALDALEQASILGELYYHVTQSSFGPFVGIENYTIIFASPVFWRSAQVTPALQLKSQ